MLAASSSHRSLGRPVGRPALLLLGIAIASLGAVFAVSAWSFVNPSRVQSYRLAAISDFAPGTVTTYIRNDDRLEHYTRQSPSPEWGWFGSVPSPGGELVHVVRLQNGQFRVLSGVSRHLRQTVLWFPDGAPEVSDVRGLFGDDFSWWLIDGTRIFGPTPRDLPTYGFEVDDAGILVIDLSGPVEGELRVEIRPR